MKQKEYTWNVEKNRQLKQDDNRNNIGFEEIVTAISNGNLLDVILHPNVEKYPTQKIFIVEINNYVYCVPFVENEDEIFLKTIFPERKMTKKYLKNDTGK